MRPTITAIIKDKKGRILSIGKNSYVKTHPMQARIGAKVGHPAKIYLHAEVAAIVACKQLKHAHSIHIFRFDKHGKPMLAAPCGICTTAIDSTPIKEVFHT